MERQEGQELMILKLMFISEDMRNKIWDSLDEDFFMNYDEKKGNNDYFRELSRFVKEYGYFPTDREFRDFMGEDLHERHKALEDLDMDDLVQSRYMMKQVEKWLREKIVRKHFHRMLAALKEHDMEAVSAISVELGASAHFALGETEGFNPISEAGADEVYNSITAQKIRKVGCGIESMDALMDGGWSEKSLSGVLLGTHQGKTMFLCTSAANAIRKGKKALYVSLEEGSSSIASRIVRNLIERDKNEIRAMTLMEFRELVGKAVEGRRDNLRVMELPESGTTPALLLSRINLMIGREKFVPDVIFVDYVGKMTPNGKRTNYPTHERLSDVTVQVRDISKTSLSNHPPIVTAWQYNKEGVKTMSGELTEMGSSYAQAHTADIIWAGYRADGDDGQEEGVITFKLAKGRECAENAVGGKAMLACRYGHQAMVDKEAEENRQYSDSYAPCSDGAGKASQTSGFNADMFKD